MYFSSAVIVLAGLSSLAGAAVSYDDGMYHPDPTTTTYAQVTTKATTYVSVISETAKTSETPWYPTLSQSTYIGHWSQNTTTTSSYKTSATTSYTTHSGASNMTMTMKPGNFSMTVTMTDRM